MFVYFGNNGLLTPLQCLTQQYESTTLKRCQEAIISKVHEHQINHSHLDPTQRSSILEDPSDSDMVPVSAPVYEDVAPVINPLESFVDSTDAQIAQLSAAQKSTYDTLIAMGFDTSDTLVVARVFGGNVHAASDAILNGTVDTLRRQNNPSPFATLRERDRPPPSFFEQFRDFQRWEDIVSERKDK